MNHFFLRYISLSMHNRYILKCKNMKFIRLKKKLYNQLCFLLAHTCNIFFIICALVYVNTKASRISMHDFYRRLKIIVALEKPIIFYRTNPFLLGIRMEDHECCWLVGQLCCRLCSLFV